MLLDMNFLSESRNKILQEDLNLLCNFILTVYDCKSISLKVPMERIFHDFPSISPKAVVAPGVFAYFKLIRNLKIQTREAITITIP